MIRIRWQPLALIGLTVLGLALRLYGLNWDQGNSFHPDERQIMFHVTALAWPHSLAQFLDPVNSPLNPHFFAYGSFPLYLLAILGNLLAHFSPALASFTQLTLVGRVLSAIFDSGTILLTGWLGLLLTEDQTPQRRGKGAYVVAERGEGSGVGSGVDIASGVGRAWSVALLAAALVAFTPFQLQLSHFYAVDTMLLFFVMLMLLACVALVDTNAPIRWSLVTGLGYGLALATKFSAAPLVVPLLVALLLRWRRWGFHTVLWPCLTSIVTTILVFLIAMPYALLDLKNFMQQVSEQGDLARGLLDYPYVRQFAGTVPYVYEVQNIFWWGMGVMLGLAAFAGFAWLLWRVWRRQFDLWLIMLSWVIVYGGIVGSFYVKFMRYMLPIYPCLTLMGAALLVALVYRTRAKERNYTRLFVATLPICAIVLVLAGTAFQGLALLNVYSQPNTRVQASRWMYSHLKPGSVLTFEQWDDPLPVAVGNNDPSIYQQATYTDNGQPTQGLDLYGDDTTQKAQWLANLLPNVDVITMATDRLDKSIPRLPLRYPLTIHYYQLLFSGQLGFHLAAQFENHPNLFGLTLNDSSADESYSVFDHPTVRIFVRDNPYPYTSDQLLQKLLAGVQLPTLGAQLSGAQQSLLLTPQQIADDQQSPTFSVQFPADSLANAAPILFWWLALLALGLSVYPLFFSALRGLRDRGYIFSKTLGVLLLGYIAWLLASLHILAFSQLSILLVLLVLLLVSIAVCVWQRQAILLFLRQHWRLLLLEEAIFTLAFLLFVGIRSLNPDLWHILLGGEKPQELAFLNAVLRSPYMPPYDPWFAGGYINYYYYGYVLIGSLIKLTGIVPTTAFNLAIPTLFALTFSGVVALVYSLTQKFHIALLGGYFAVLISNLNGLAQLKAQLAALLLHLRPSAFDYWQSSRIIPFTINEFPFWSFLFADLHPHVIDLPIVVLMLGLVVALLLSAGEVSAELPNDSSYKRRRGNISLYLLAAFVFGTIACVNPWDMPVYALLLGIALILRTVIEKRREPRGELLLSLGFSLVTTAVLCGLGYLLYWPFYASYQQLYVNGLGRVQQGTNLGDYLTIAGLWIFLTLSFFLLEFWPIFRDSLSKMLKRMKLKTSMSTVLHVVSYLLLSLIVFAVAAALGLKVLLGMLVALGAFLFAILLRSILRTPDAPVISTSSLSNGTSNSVTFPTPALTYVLLLLGLCISLGVEIVYIRDFLDGGDYERMNTVFKFMMQAWLCFAIGGALAIQQLWDRLGGIVRRVWSVMLVALVLGCSVFLVEGTAARIGDHQVWVSVQAPVENATYAPTLDGFAFVHAWYPGDAEAIAWLNVHVSGSPVILEAASPSSYQWYNRVSVFTGLPDVLGWSDHEYEQRYDFQSANRLSDISTIYTTPDTAQAIEFLRSYHVRYIYVGQLERDLYAQGSSVGLDKFDHMVGTTLSIVYRADGVTIYEVV